MMRSLKLVALSTSLALLMVGCGGGSSTTATAPATEGVNNQLASSVSIAGFDSLSLAQASQATGTTQTAMLPKLFDWVTNLMGRLTQSKWCLDKRVGGARTSCTLQKHTSIYRARLTAVIGQIMTQTAPNSPVTNFDV